MATDLEADMALLEDRVETVESYLDSVRAMVANVRAGFDDDEGWVLRDNLRRLPLQIGRVHLELGRSTQRR